MRHGRAASAYRMQRGFASYELRHAPLGRLDLGFGRFERVLKNMLYRWRSKLSLRMQPYNESGTNTIKTYNQQSREEHSSRCENETVPLIKRPRWQRTIALSLSLNHLHRTGQSTWRREGHRAGHNLEGTPHDIEIRVKSIQ